MWWVCELLDVGVGDGVVFMCFMHDMDDGNGGGGLLA